MACSLRNSSQGILSQEQTQVGNRYLKIFSLCRRVFVNLGCTLESHGKSNILLPGPLPPAHPPRGSDLLSPGIRILFCKIILYSQIMPAYLNVNIFYNLGALIKIKKLTLVQNYKKKKNDGDKHLITIFRSASHQSSMEPPVLSHLHYTSRNGT